MKTENQYRAEIITNTLHSFLFLIRLIIPFPWFFLASWIGNSRPPQIKQTLYMFLFNWNQLKALHVLKHLFFYLFQFKDFLPFAEEYYLFPSRVVMLSKCIFINILKILS